MQGQENREGGLVVRCISRPKIASLKAVCVRSFMKEVSMAKQLHTSHDLRSHCTVPSVNWHDVKYGVNRLWSSGNVL